MKFCTVITCMDGRVQLPVIKYLQDRFDIEYVDTITEPGPNLILAEQKEAALLHSIFARLKISIVKHNSIGVAVVGHYDCAGNPASEDKQIVHTEKAVELVRKQHAEIEVIGLWVDENWKVNEIT